MRPTLILMVPILAMLALAACSDGEEPDAVEPPVNPRWRRQRGYLHHSGSIHQGFGFCAVIGG